MIYHLENRSLIKISGHDAGDFLQNLVTNDVTKLAPDQILYACLLTPQGRFLHDLFLTGTSTEIFLECESARREDILKRLKFYKLRAQITIEDCHEQFSVYAASQKPEGYPSFQDPRRPELGYRFYLPASASLSTSHGAAEYRDLRISLGIPEGGTEIKPEGDTIANVNLDFLNAVSWDKGCYTGQEITAMTENRGTVKRRMAIISGENLAIGDVLQQDGHTIGDIRAVNTRQTQALAIVKLSSITTSGAPITDSKNANVFITLPQWLPPEIAC